MTKKYKTTHCKLLPDDDSSIRSLLKHKSLYPKGRLLEDMPVLDWLADPSHRTKVVAKPIYLLACKLMHQGRCYKI